MYCGGQKQLYFDIFCLIDFYMLYNMFISTNVTMYKWYLHVVVNHIQTDSMQAQDILFFFGWAGGNKPGESCRRCPIVEWPCPRTAKTRDGRLASDLKGFSENNSRSPRLIPFTAKFG